MAERREPQYQLCVDLKKRIGLTPLGLMSNQAWYDDPKRLLFLMSRYKFVAKMLSGSDRVLEIGCADAFATRIVVSEVRNLTAVDFDPVFVADVQSRMQDRWRFDIQVHDILQGPVAGVFDAAYAMDFIEHIPAQHEDTVMKNICQSLTDHSTLIFGTPSLESQAYASAPSRAGHINCKDAKGLKAPASKYFHNVFMFSMNDEVVHTGFFPMAQYLIALCCGKKSPPVGKDR